MFAAHNVMLYGVVIQAKLLSLDRMVSITTLNPIGAGVHAATVARDRLQGRLLGIKLTIDHRSFEDGIRRKAI